jgi:RNA polymerase sigma factor (sigma-70 family)
MDGKTLGPTFEEIVLPHLDCAYNLARWLSRNEDDAQDVVQEAYLRAFRYFPTFHGEGAGAKGWLLKIVRNTFYSWLDAGRHTQKWVELDEETLPQTSRVPEAERFLLQSDTAVLVRRAMEGLPPNYREVLVLRELEGMSYKEIAQITGLPQGTVMSSLSRGRGRLREALASLATSLA